MDWKGLLSGERMKKLKRRASDKNWKENEIRGRDAYMCLDVFHLSFHMVHLPFVC